MDFPKCGNLPGDPPGLSPVGQGASKASDLNDLELVVGLK